MKTKLRWLGVIPLLMLGASMSCSSDESDDGSGGGTSGTKLDTGEACAKSTECFGGLCLTDETFAELAESDAGAEIPGGYCSKLNCTNKNQPEGDCGPKGFCFDLEQFVETPLTACFAPCESASECRGDYKCTDISGFQYEPLPKKACLPIDLLCLLDVPTEKCPDVGPPKDGGTEGGDAGADAAADSATDAPATDSAADAVADTSAD